MSKKTNDCFVGVRIPRDCLDEVKDKSEKCGMSVSEYFREVVLNHDPKQKLSLEDRELLAGLDDARHDIKAFTNAIEGKAKGFAPEARKAYILNGNSLEDWASSLRVELAFIDKIRRKYM